MLALTLLRQKHYGGQALPTEREDQGESVGMKLALTLCPPPGEGAPSAGLDCRDHSVNAGAVGRARRSKPPMEFGLLFLAARLNRSGPGRGGGWSL